MAVRAEVTADGVQITCTGWDALWSFRRSLSVPFDRITSARVAPRREVVRRLLIRIGGTFWPGAVCAGHFLLRHKGGRAWTAMYRDPEVLVIECQGPGVRMIAIQHPDRHDLAWWIGERI